ncbi:hypothetical protein G6677_05805 [Polynucleobacter paneuropaeus]|nr:hypothetical protein [Polynucleobacter paneuropaeus]
MTKISIVLGNLNADLGQIAMSGLRWIVKDKQYCKAGTRLAYCNLQLLDADSVKSMAGEMNDFQLVFIAPIDGILHIGAGTSHGGLLDQLPNYVRWKSDFVICEVEPTDLTITAHAIPVGLIFAAGQRNASFAENRNGILSGWFQKTRVWSGSKGKVEKTLITLGVCDLLNTIRGDQIVSLQMMELISKCPQLILISDGLVILAAVSVLENLQRTPKDIEAVSLNFHEMVKAYGQSFGAEDYLFLGALLTTLTSNYLAQSSTTMTREGLHHECKPNIVLTSLSAQPRRIFKHKTLGYSVAFHEFRFTKLSKLVRRFIAENFETIIRTPQEIIDDLIKLADYLGPSIQLIVANRPANPLVDPITRYGLYDAQTFDDIEMVQYHEVNYLLSELAAKGVLDVVDVDMIASKLGVKKHVPDGAHWSGQLELQVAKEISRLVSMKSHAM